MNKSPKNEFKAFIGRLHDGFWYPNESNFRHRINLEARHALVHFLKNKDVTLFSRLVDSIPNAHDKLKIKQHAAEKLPLQIKGESGLFIVDKQRWQFFKMGIIANFNLMEPLIVSKSSRGIVRMDVGNITPEELISIAADVIVENRRSFSKEQIDHIIDLLQNISKRQNTTYSQMSSNHG